MERNEIYRADQLRTLKKFKEAWKTGKGKLIKTISSEIRQTPSYKTYQKEKLKGGAGIGGLVGTSGLLTGRTAKQRILRGLIGAAAGTGTGIGIGKALSEMKLKRFAKVKASNVTSNLFQRELQKNKVIHKILAQPGIQKLTVKRPWGQENYSG